MGPMGVEIEMRNEMWSWELLRGLRRIDSSPQKEKIAIDNPVRGRGIHLYPSPLEANSGQTPGESVETLIFDSPVHVIKVFEPEKLRKRIRTVILEL